MASKFITKSHRDILRTIESKQLRGVDVARQFPTKHTEVIYSTLTRMEKADLVYVSLAFTLRSKTALILYGLTEQGRQHLARLEDLCKIHT